MTAPSAVGDDLYTIYAETASKRAAADTLADRLEPLRVRSKIDALVEQR